MHHHAFIMAFSNRCAASLLPHHFHTQHTHTHHHPTSSSCSFLTSAQQPTHIITGSSCLHTAAHLQHISLFHSTITHISSSFGFFSHSHISISSLQLFAHLTRAWCHPVQVNTIAAFCSFQAHMRHQPLLNAHSAFVTGSHSPILSKSKCYSSVWWSHQIFSRHLSQAIQTSLAASSIQATFLQQVSNTSFWISSFMDTNTSPTKALTTHFNTIKS